MTNIFNKKLQMKRRQQRKHSNCPQKKKKSNEKKQKSENKLNLTILKELEEQRKRHQLESIEKEINSSSVSFNSISISSNEKLTQIHM